MTTESRELRNWFNTDVLQKMISSLIASEVLCPSEELWMISPWISDIPIIDNRAGEFSAIVPEWDYGKISLSQIINFLTSHGTNIYIVTRNNEWSQGFLRNVSGKINISVKEDKFIHEKGLLARDNFYLEGSFNFTFNGITLNKEKANLHIERTILSETRIDYVDWWQYNAS